VSGPAASISAVITRSAVWEIGQLTGLSPGGAQMC
jgi:hypothetical protein